MRNCIISFLLAISALSVQATEYAYLTFKMSDGEEYSLAVSGLSIQFSDGNLVASDGTTLPLAQLSKMYFSSTSAISPVEVRGGAVDIFNLRGERLGTYPSWPEAQKALGKGVYVIKDIKGRTEKRLKK